MDALGQLGGGGLPDTEGQSGAVLDVEVVQAVETFGQLGGGGLPDTEGQYGAIVDVEAEQVSRIKNVFSVIFLIFILTLFFLSSRNRKSRIITVKGSMETCDTLLY